MLFGKKKKTMLKISFEPKKQKAVLKCSICSGEQVAGKKLHWFDEGMIENGEE